MSLNQTLARLSDIGGNQAVPLANRNWFVDGAFDFWTASSSALPSSGSYGAATMWQCWPGTGGAGSIIRANAQSNNILGESNMLNYAVFAQTTASTGTVAAGTVPYFLQRVEGVNRFAGKSVTLSFKIWINSGSITIPQVISRQFFGTGGSPSAQNNADKAVNWVITTTPKRFSVRLDVPSISGKTLGTNGDDNVFFGFYLPPGVTFQIGIAEAQVEQCSPNSSGDINGNGGAPTVFEYRGMAAELDRMLRYYENAYIFPTYINLVPTASLAAYMQAITYQVPKRATGAVSFAGVGYYSGGTPTTMPVGNISAVAASNNGVTLYLNGGMTNCFGCSGGQYTCDARL